MRGPRGTARGAVHTDIPRETTVCATRQRELLMCHVPSPSLTPGRHCWCYCTSDNDDDGENRVQVLRHEAQMTLQGVIAPPQDLFDCSCPAFTHVVDTSTGQSCAHRGIWLEKLKIAKCGNIEVKSLHM